MEAYCSERSVRICWKSCQTSDHRDFSSYVHSHLSLYLYHCLHHSLTHSHSHYQSDHVCHVCCVCVCDDVQQMYASLSFVCVLCVFSSAYSSCVFCVFVLCLHRWRALIVSAFVFSVPFELCVSVSIISTVVTHTHIHTHKETREIKQTNEQLV